MKETLINLKKTWTFVKESKKEFYLYILSHIVSIFISIVVPLLSSKIIIELTSNNYYQIILIALVIFIVENLRNLMNYLQMYCTQKIYFKTFNKLQITLGSKILTIENSILDKNNSGIFIQRISNDATRLSDIFNAITLYLSNIITDIGIFSAIYIINKWAFILVFISTIIRYSIERTRVNKRNENDKEFRKEKDKISGFTGELCRGIRDIKMLNAEKSFLKELEQGFIRLNKARYKFQDIDRKYRLLGGFSSDLIDLVLIIILVYLMKNASLAAASALVIYNYAGRINNFVYNISFLLEKAKDFNLSSERVFEILDDNIFTKEKFGNKHVKKVKGNFEFKNVYFSYGNNKVLNGTSFKINSKETVAFVGKSGAGKTTIFSLLCKMYDINSGEILIDGINVNELDRDSIRGNITIISQDPYIFNMSIKDNLRLVKRNVTNKEIIEACKKARLYDFIMDLPDKFDTVVGEGGITLSGGQKQRLAIARALIQKTEIILFDEATSALDNETQMQITKAINNMKDKYTILIIAHRLSTIKNSDRILMLDKGKIIAEGSHKELLKNSKEYQKLYENELEKNN